ncbi:MAG: twin-arginine translocation pathway signal protein [Desulfobulbaceae bacterium A2]|nr:MAG: twin-arginine translocation pathway signal protein [Desulfobulbaceae bacterium A2]
MGINLTRRSFLRAASLAAASVPLSRVAAKASAGAGLAPTAIDAQGSFKGTETVTGGVCEMCFWRCQLVGKVRDGRLVKLEGNPKSIDNGTAICARGNAGVQLLYDPDRLKFPMKNVGERGKPKWKEISWDEALNETAKRLKGVVDKYGPHGIAMFPHGASATYPLAFFEKVVGTPNISEASFFQCRGIRDMAYINTIGTNPDENVDMPNAKVMFFLGCHLGENIHVSHMKKYLKGLENGAKLIVVDPRFSASAAKANLWLPIRPGTDTAFLLAIMNYLIQQGKYDRAFVVKYGKGFDKFAAGIREWSLEKAAKECDLTVAQIKETADMLAAGAPHVSVHPGRHVSWYGNDFQRERALACLTGLLGAIGVKGGFVKPKGPKVKGVNWKGEEKEEFSMRHMAHVHHYSPPGTPTDLIRNACVTGKPYPIKAAVIWGQNPIQTIPNQQLMVKSLMQMDFVLAVDLMPTDAVMYADILLPEPCYLERYDVIKTGTQWNFADAHQQYIAPRMPLVRPMFERRDSVFITNEIAKRMGYGDKIPCKTQEERLEKSLASAELTIDKIKAAGGIHIQPGKDPYGPPADLEVLFHNPEIEQNGYPGIPTYVPVPPVPKGYARLVYGRVPVHTFSRSTNNIWLHHEMPKNPIWINEDVATKMGLKSGYHVRLVNSEGVTSTGTSVILATPGIRKDTVFIAHGYGIRNPAMHVAYNQGIDDNELVSKGAVDPETGAHGMRTSFVKVVRRDGQVVDFPA